MISPACPYPPDLRSIHYYRLLLRDFSVAVEKRSRFVDHRDLKINVTAPWHLVNAVNRTTCLLVDLAFIRTCAVFTQSFDQLMEPFPDWSIGCVFRLLDVYHLIQYIFPTNVSLDQRSVLEQPKHNHLLSCVAYMLVQLYHALPWS